jgi:hypothetical protein
MSRKKPCAVIWTTDWNDSNDFLETTVNIIPKLGSGIIGLASNKAAHCRFFTNHRESGALGVCTSAVKPSNR